MAELINEQRYFIKLFIQLTSAPRKALLQTITKRQLRALSQIAHNTVSNVCVKLSFANIREFVASRIQSSS